MEVLIIDDQPSARRILHNMLKSVGGINTHEASNLENARLILTQNNIDIALIDIRLSDDPRNRDGHTLVKEINQRHTALPVVITSLSEMEEIREAMRNGAFDYIIKDALSEDMLIPIIEKLRQHRLLVKEVQHLRARNVDQDVPGFVLGSSKIMADLMTLIQRVALSDRPVLVTGPTGSGKELVVRSVHRLGSQPDAPFFAINCGGIPDNLIESQLFGHERGSFTGAVNKQEGYFSAVRNGTLFLDEIAELPLELQPGLLRVLETRSFRPIGAIKEQQFNGRIIAATNADLERNVLDKTFREDLFYRLNVFQIKVPPLDDHREDIPSLISSFLKEQPRKMKFTEDAMKTLINASWPGNIRQLRNTIDKLTVLCDKETISGETLETYISSTPKNSSAILDALAGNLLRLDLDDDTDRLATIRDAIIVRAMRETNGNKSAAAKLLGVHRKVIERSQQK